MKEQRKFKSRSDVELHLHEHSQSLFPFLMRTVLLPLDLRLRMDTVSQSSARRDSAVAMRRASLSVNRLNSADSVLATRRKSLAANRQNSVGLLRGRMDSIFKSPAKGHSVVAMRRASLVANSRNNVLIPEDLLKSQQRGSGSGSLQSAKSMENPRPSLDLDYLLA